MHVISTDVCCSRSHHIVPLFHRHHFLSIACSNYEHSIRIISYSIDQYAFSMKHVSYFPHFLSPLGICIKLCLHVALVFCWSMDSCSFVEFCDVHCKINHDVSLKSVIIFNQLINIINYLSYYASTPPFAAYHKRLNEMVP